MLKSKLPVDFNSEYLRLEKMAINRKVMSIDKLNEYSFDTFDVFRTAVLDMWANMGFIEVELMKFVKGTISQWTYGKGMLIKVLDRRAKKKDIDEVARKLRKLLNRKKGFAFKIGADWWEEI